MLLVSNGKALHDLAIWKMCVQATLERKKLISALTEDDAESLVDEKAMSTLITALGGSPLQLI